MKELISVNRLERYIFFIRSHRVMLASDLAELYGVTTGHLNRAVKRNLLRFPRDFMFQLTQEEHQILRCQIGILEKGRHSKYLPYVFTQEGVAMLSSVLHSEKAILVNVHIMRAFVRLREVLATHGNLARKLEEMEKKYNAKFRMVFDAIRKLMDQPGDPPPRVPLVKGFEKE